MRIYVYRPRFYFLPLVANATPAFLATLALFFLMRSLIATDMNPPEVQNRERIEFISEVPEITELPPIERPNRPEEVAREPERMQPKVMLEVDDRGGPGDRNPALEQG